MQWHVQCFWRIMLGHPTEFVHIPLVDAEWRS